MTAHTLIHPALLAVHLEVAAGRYDDAARFSAGMDGGFVSRDYESKAADARRMAAAFRNAGTLGWDGDYIEVC